MTAKLRIAVAGAGMIGRRHIDLIEASPLCELAAIVDPAPAAVALARTARVALHPSLTALLRADRVDGVIVATPNALHVEQGLECIEARVAALIEKPVAHTVAAATRLRDAAEHAGASILVGHHRRHGAIMSRAREIIQAGTLGPLVAVTGSALFYKPDPYFSDAPWRTKAGGGPILINMIHEVDNLRMLCGEIVEVQALASNGTRGFPVEDTVAIALRFANGALGTFALSDTAASVRSWEQTSRENAAYASYSDEDCYLVAGTRGSLAIPTMRVRTYSSDEDRSWFRPMRTNVSAVAEGDPLERQLAHFCAVIRGEAVPLVTVSDGLQNLRITEAIGHAVDTGRSVATL